MPDRSGKVVANPIKANNGFVTKHCMVLVNVYKIDLVSVSVVSRDIGITGGCLHIINYCIS